jgi:hypothetical protein
MLKTENNLWPGIARHFPDNQYVFQDDNTPVHRARIAKKNNDERENPNP